MNYIYSESVISNPVSMVIMTNKYIITAHHMTIRIFTYDLKQVREKNFCEKILQLKKVDENYFAILFDGGKFLQITYDFKPYCLRLVRGLFLEIYNGVGLVYDNYKLSYFKLDEEHIDEIHFSSIGIFDIVKVVFISAYTPTIIIMWRDKEETKCSTVTLDKNYSIIDTFQVINGVINFQNSDGFLTFLSRNHIQIKYKRELITLNLNKDSEIQRKFSSFNLNIDELNDNVYLENPQVFVVENNICIFNGDGELYVVKIQMDTKKILDISISRIFSSSPPSCLYFYNNTVFLGSILSDSFCYKVEYDENGISNSLRLQVKASIKHVGLVNDFCLKKNGDLVTCSDDSFLILSNYFKYNITGECNIDYFYDDVFVLENNIYFIKDKIVRKISSLEYFNYFSADFTKKEKTKLGNILKFNLQDISLSNLNINSYIDNFVSEVVNRHHSENNIYKNFRYKIDSSSEYLAFLTNNGILEVYNSGNIYKKFEKVICFSLYGSKISFISYDSLFIYDLNACKIIFCNTNISKFENEISNSIFLVNEKLIQINEKLNNESITMKKSNIKDSIVEILIREEFSIYIFIRTEMRLYLYKLSDNILSKIFIPKIILFSSTSKSLFNLDKFVYLDSNTPFVVILNDTQLFYNFYPRLKGPFSFGENLYMIEKCTISQLSCSKNMETLQFCGDFIIRKYQASHPQNNENKFSKYNNNFITNNSQFHKSMKIQSESHDIQHVPPKNTLELNKNIKLSSGINNSINDDGENDILNNIININSNVYDQFDSSVKSEINEICQQKIKILIPTEKITNKRKNKRIISTKNSIIVASAKYVNFTLVPFVPMVHSADPDGKPISEPIDKEPKVNNNPVLQGRTLKYYIELYSGKYQFISSFELEDNELVTDLKYLMDLYVVLSTSFCEGEDKMVKGRILIFIVTDIVPDLERPYADKKLKLVSIDQFKSPCLCCDEIRGHIAACIGTRLMIYEIDINNGLTAIGRHEISVLSTSLFTINNYMFLTDVYNGGYFFFMRPKDPLKLHLLGHTDPVNNGWNVNGIVFSQKGEVNKNDILSLLICDKNGQIHVYTYSPDYEYSNRGMHLLKRAQINTKLQSLKTTKLLKYLDDTALMIVDNVVGKLKVVEAKFLIIFQNCIAAISESSCGINLRNYLEPNSYTNVESKSIVSERVLLEFFYMNTKNQENVLNKAGVSFQDLLILMDSIYSS